MTPSEKAVELASRFLINSVFGMTDTELRQERTRAKQSALIAVEEIIRVTGAKYWYDVKNEIEKL